MRLLFDSGVPSDNKEPDLLAEETGTKRFAVIVSNLSVKPQIVFITRPAFVVSGLFVFVF